jgi:hypothetical protein
LVLFLFFRKCLPCVFYGGARQRAVIAVRFQWLRTAKAKDCRAFLPTVHGKGKRLPCVFTYGARQRQKIAVRFFASARQRP